MAQDDDLLKVDWASHRGIFPFSGVDRIESVQELDQLTRLIDEKVSDGTLSLDDEPAEDGLLYGTLFKVNRGRMDRMAEEFKALAEREQLSSYDLACEVVRCIQKVPYVIPDQVTSDHPLGIFTPNEVAHYDGGDCDTKSLMAAILLSRLGYHCVLFGSDYYRHAMLGVEVPGSDGYYADYEGHRYWWVEMTAYDAPIGGRPSECLDDSKWVITPLE